MATEPTKLQPSLVFLIVFLFIVWIINDEYSLRLLGLLGLLLGLRLGLRKRRRRYNNYRDTWL